MVRFRRTFTGGALGLALAVATACAVAVSGASAQSDDTDSVKAVFKAGSASLVPQDDGTIRVVLDDLEKKASVEDAPKGVDPLALFEADADGAIEARLTADKAPEGADEHEFVLTDVRYEDEDSISAVATPADEPVEGDPSPTPEGQLKDVTLETKIDRPAANAPLPQSGSGSGNYTITMQWQANHLSDLTSWTFAPTSKTCIDNERDTRHVDITYPTGGRGWPFTQTDYALVVNNSGDCFWKYSSMEFRITVGRDFCDYSVEQVGPRTFTAKSLRMSSGVRNCDASGGVNTVTGYIAGRDNN